MIEPLITEHMTIQQVKNDLNKKCPDKDDYASYFLVPLEKGEIRWGRRTFSDLFNHYNKKGVTEEQLMKAIIKARLNCYFCDDIRRFVFFRMALRFKIFSRERKILETKVPGTSKYTFKYLEELYDSVSKK